MGIPFLTGIETSGNITLDSPSAVGETVFDVQGTQGQLFSVTNSLTGDLFSVSDISGIPIFNVNSSGIVTIDGNIQLADNDKIQIGNAQDLELYHDGSNSYIKDNGTGSFIVNANGSNRFFVGSDVGVLDGTDFFIAQGRKLLLDGAGGHTYIEEESDSNLKFYVAGSERLNITNTDATFAGNVSVVDNKYFAAGTGGDLIIRHLSSDNSSYIQSYTGDFNIENRATTKSMFFRVSNSSAGDTTAVTIKSDGNVGIGTSFPTGKLEIQRTQITTQFDRDSFLRLHPTTTTNSGGFTNIFFGTSPVNNYGVAIGGLRAGTDGTPSFSVRMLNDSITGTEVLNINNAGNATFTGGVTVDGTAVFKHGGTTFKTTFAHGNEINTETAAGADATMYLNYRSGTVNIANSALKVNNAGDSTIKGHLIPHADATYDLGTTNSLDFRTLYVREIDIFNQRFRLDYSGTIARLQDHSSVGDGFQFLHLGTEILRLGNGSSTTATFAGNLTVNNTITTPTDTNLSLSPNGSGHVYFGNAGNGMNLYHYSSANDGKYATYDFNGNYYRISTTSTSGVWINDPLRIEGAVDINSNVDISGNTLINAQLAVNSTTINAANKLEVHGQARVSGAMMIGDASISNTAAGGQLHIKNSGEAVIRLEDSDNSNLAFDVKVNEGEGFVITETIGGQSGGDNNRLVIAETTGNATFSGTVTGSNLSGTNTGDQDLTSYLQNIVEDTSPQLGGNLDMNGKYMFETTEATASIDLKDHNNYTWFRNSTNRWVFQGGGSGDDWTQSFHFTLESVGSGFNDKLLLLGQQINNGSAGGKYKGVRIVKSTGSSSVVDGYLQAGEVSVTGDLTVTGNLTVDGTTTTLNTQTIEVEDNILQLNTTQGSPDTATAATSGISIYRGDGVTQASLIFDDADDRWDLTNHLRIAGQLTVDSHVQTTRLYNTGDLTVLNKAGSAWLTFADRNTSASEVVYDLANVGTISTSGNATFGGKVGIGMTPTEVLDLKASSGDTRMRLDAASGSDTEIKFFNDGVAQYTIGHDDATDNFVIGGANVDAPLVSIGKTGDTTFAGILKAKGNIEVIDSDGTLSHGRLNSNGTEGYLTVSNGSNWGFIARGQGNDPRIGAWYGGTLRIEGMHSPIGATGSNAIDFAQFQFGNDHFQMNAATSTFSGDVTTNGDIIIDNSSGDPFLKLKTAAQEYVIRIDQSDSEKFQIRDVTNSATRLTITTAGDANFGGKVKAATTFISDATDPGNPTPAQDNLRVSGYGVIGKRGAVYLTNAGTSSTDSVQIGVGGVHAAATKLLINPTNSIFSTNIHANADSTYDIGTNATRFANGYFDTLYGDGSNLTGVTTTDSTKVAKAGDTMTGDLTLDDGSGASPSLILKNSTDETWEIYNGTHGVLNFYENSNLRLSFAQGGDATFTGNVETDKIFVAKGQNLSHTTSSIKISQESTTKSQIRFYGGDTSTAGSLEFVGSSSNGSAGGVRLTINANGSSTFAGTVTATGGNISSSVSGGDSFLISTSASTTGRGFVKSIGDTGAVLFSAVYGSESTGTIFGASLTRAAAFVTTSDTSVHPTSLLVGTYTEIPLIFGTNNVERLKIDGTAGTASFSGNVKIQKNTPRLELGTSNVSTGNAEIRMFSKNGNNANAYYLKYNKDTGIDRLEFIDGSGNANIQFNNGGSATFAGDVTAPGVYVGSANTSFDFYNNGTSYLNGTVTVDAAFTQSGGDASTFSGSVAVKNALIDNASVLDIDSTTTTVASVAKATYTAAFFDYVIKKGENVRAGVVYACHDGTNVEFAETSTVDLGDTSDVTLSITIDSTNMMLKATTTSNDWSVKTLIRAI